MRDWLEDRGLRYVVAEVKADKLSGNGRVVALRDVRAALGGEPILASAVSGLGIREIWARLDAALGA